MMGHKMLGPKKCVDHKMLCPKKWYAQQKNFCFQKNLMSTNVLSKKIVCPKTGFVKICCVENVSPKKIFFKKFLFQKFSAPRNIGLENLVQKNWSKDN